jgi:arylsulfatase
MVANIDENVGRMLAKLDEWGTEKAHGPRINTFKALYWKQFGGGPTPEDLKKMDPDSPPGP